MRQRAAETASSVECVGIKKLPTTNREAGSWELDSTGKACPPSRFALRRVRRSLGGGGKVGLYHRRLAVVARSLVRSTDARGADEQPLAVREGDVTAVRAVRTVLGLEALDDDLEIGRASCRERG